MADVSKYVLDANIFIEAKRRYYAFNLCPGFWKAVLHHNTRGNLVSIDRVKKELVEGKDDLAEWSKKARDLFVSTDKEVVISFYRDVVLWAQGQDRFSPAEKSAFADDVDAWIIAYAKANHGIVITHERSAERSTRIKIPDVCREFGVECKNTFEMLQELKVVFHWDPQ